MMCACTRSAHVAHRTASALGSEGQRGPGRRSAAQVGPLAPWGRRERVVWKVGAVLLHTTLNPSPPGRRPGGAPCSASKRAASAGPLDWCRRRHVESPDGTQPRPRTAGPAASPCPPDGSKSRHVCHACASHIAPVMHVASRHVETSKQCLRRRRPSWLKGASTDVYRPLPAVRFSSPTLPHLVLRTHHDNSAVPRDAPRLRPAAHSMWNGRV